MFAECVRAFRDFTHGMREEGERFEVTEERFAQINGTRYGQLVKAVDAVERPKRRRRKDDEGSAA